MTNVPVLVDGRIIDCIDQARAESMVDSPNVKLIRARSTGLIMRAIVSPMVDGEGDTDKPSSFMDSRRAHTREILFNTDDAPRGNIKGMPFVFTPKTIPVLARPTKRDAQTRTRRQSRRRP